MVRSIKKFLGQLAQARFNSIDHLLEGHRRGSLGKLDHDDMLSSFHAWK